MSGGERTTAFFKVAAMVAVRGALAARGDFQHLRHQIGVRKGFETLGARFRQLAVMRKLADAPKCPGCGKHCVPLANPGSISSELDGCTSEWERLGSGMIRRQQSSGANACEDPPFGRGAVLMKGAGPDIFLVEENVGKELECRTALGSVRTHVQILVANIRSGGAARRWRSGGGLARVRPVVLLRPGRIRAA